MFSYLLLKKKNTVCIRRQLYNQLWPRVKRLSFPSGPSSPSGWDQQSVQGVLQALPVPPEEGEEADGQHGGEHMVAAPHERRGKLGGGGDAHQDDGDDGQHDVDALAQQDAGVMALQLHRLLLVLLLELQL